MKSSPVLERRVLGQGGFGRVQGPSHRAVLERIQQRGGIDRKKISVHKLFARTPDFRAALRLEKVVNGIDPTRVYLRGKVLEKDSKNKTLILSHEGKSLDSVSKTNKNRRLLLESFHQLLQALILLRRHRFVHLDIKSGNITMDTRTGLRDPATAATAVVGLIDFDLLSGDRSFAVSHPQHAYFVWPLEMYYDRKNDRFTLFDERRRPHPDPDKALRTILRDYLTALAFLENEDGAVVARMKGLLRGKKTVGNEEGVVQLYLETLSDPVIRRRELKRDASKVDTFGLGQVAYEWFHDKGNSLFAGHVKKEELRDQLENFIQQMLHPLPSQRYDAEQALEAWLRLLADYDRNLYHRAQRELQLPLSPYNVRFPA